MSGEVKFDYVMLYNINSHLSKLPLGDELVPYCSEFSLCYKKSIYGRFFIMGQKVYYGRVYYGENVYYGSMQYISLRAPWGVRGYPDGVNH